MNLETQKEKKSAASGEETQTHLFARQPLSVPGKIAFWASIVGGIISLGGNVTLVMLTGSPSLDSVIGLLCWLTCIVILATRLRWAPVVSTLLAVCILYLLFTLPYVTESLLHPNGPNGGFAHFAGDVLALVCAILVLGGSLVTGVQNYQEANR